MQITFVTFLDENYCDGDNLCRDYYYMKDSFTLFLFREVASFPSLFFVFFMLRLDESALASWWYRKSIVSKSTDSSFQTADYKQLPSSALMLKPPPTIRALLSVRTRGVRARARARKDGRVLTLPWHPRGSNPIRRHASGYPRKVTNARGPFPLPLPPPLLSCISSRSLSYFPPSTCPSPSRGRARARLSAIKRRPYDRTRKSSTTAAQMNGMPTYAWHSRLIGCRPLLPRMKENKRTSGAELSRARWTGEAEDGLRVNGKGQGRITRWYVLPSSRACFSSNPFTTTTVICNSIRSNRLRGRTWQILVDNWTRSSLYRTLIRPIRGNQICQSSSKIIQRPRFCYTFAFLNCNKLKSLCFVID